MCCTVQQEHIHHEYHMTKADKTLNLSLSSHTRSKSLFWGDLRLSKSDHTFQSFLPNDKWGGMIEVCIVRIAIEKLLQNNYLFRLK